MRRKRRRKKSKRDPLAELWSEDPRRRSDAVGELQESLVHQGTVYEHTAAAVSGVADAALGDVVGRDDRLWLILLLAWIAGGSGRIDDVRTSHEAVRERLGEFLERLEREPDASVQVALAVLAAQFPEDAEKSLPLLELREGLMFDLAVAALGGAADAEDLLARLPDPYNDAEDVAELRARLTEEDDPRAVYRDILDDVCGTAIELRSS